MDSYKISKAILNDDNRLYKTKAYKLCHHLDITLSFSKMLQFAIYNIPSELMNNLVLFIGCTGAGKSTVINYISGVEFEQLDDEISLAPILGHFCKLKCAPPNSRSSQTLYSEILPFCDSKKRQINFADLPGFFDKNENEDYSAISALGLPILLQNSNAIKAIVIVLEYIIFTANGNKGDQFEKISKNLIQLFNDFEENRSKLNILFAITKPYLKTFDKEKIFRTIKNDLKVSSDKLESEENRKKILEKEASKFDCVDKIKFYDDIIKLLKETINQKQENLQEKIKSKLKENFKKLFSFERKNRELFIDDSELENEFACASGNEEKINLTTKLWKQKQKDLEIKRDENDKRIEEYKSEKLMIELLKEALDKKNIFIFKCFKENSDKMADDKEGIIEKIYTLEINQINKDLFKFEQTQELFNNVNAWCIKIANDVNSECIILKRCEKLIDEKDFLIKSKQKTILSYQRDLKNFVKPANLVKLNKEDFDAKNEYQNQLDFYSSLIRSYRDSIEQEKYIISQIDKTFDVHEYGFKRFTKGATNTWNYEYSYKDKSVKLFGYKRKSNIIHEVRLACWKRNFSKLLLERYFKDHDNKLIEFYIPDIGEFHVQNIEFNRGIFKLKFKKDKNFDGHVVVEIITPKNYIQKYIDKKSECQELIKSLENSQKEEKKTLDSLENMVRKEEERISFKRELIKHQTSMNRFNVIKEPLSYLHYNTEKFIKDYLLNINEKFKNKEVDILSIFNFISLEDRIPEDSYQNRIRMKLNHEKFEILNEISTVIGVSIPVIGLLALHLKEITNKKDTISLEEESDRLLRERILELETLEKSRENLKRLQKSLDTFDKIAKILSFRNINDDRFEALEASRSYLNLSGIMNKQLALKPLNKIFVENNQDCVEDNEKTLVDDSYNNDSENRIQKLQDDISYDFSLKYLMIANGKKKNITITKLQKASEQVKLSIN